MSSLGGDYHLPRSCLLLPGFSRSSGPSMRNGAGGSRDRCSSKGEDGMRSVVGADIRRESQIQCFPC